MAGCRIDRLRHARRGPVAPAIVRCAKERPALHDLARNFYDGLSRVMAAVALAASRVVHRAAGPLDPAVLLIPVCGPFPDIPGHVMKAIAVRGERADRRGP